MSEVRFIVTEMYGWSGGTIKFLRTEGQHFLEIHGVKVELTREQWDEIYSAEMKLPPITTPIAPHTDWLT